MNMRKFAFLLLLLIICLIKVHAQKLESFVDPRDRKIYKSVEFRIKAGPGGTQKWMAENLSTDRFRNGDIIPQAVTAEQWKQAGLKGKPAWCYYENNPALGVKFGKLYNWFAVNDPRGLAPQGWHVATDGEWTDLINTVNKTEKAGYLMKSKDNWSAYSNEVTEWTYCPKCVSSTIPGFVPVFYKNIFGRTKVDFVICPKCGGRQQVQVTNTYSGPGKGNDSTGFNGQPAGFRKFDDSKYDFVGKSVSGNWWTANEKDSTEAWCRSVYNSRIEISREDVIKVVGLSVRCVKDQSPEEDLITSFFGNAGLLTKWQALQGIKMNAKFSQVNAETPLTIIQLRDGRQATIAKIQGQEIKQGVFDGKELWYTNFITMKPEKSDVESVENWKALLDNFPSPLVDYQKKGFILEFVGTEKIDGLSCYKAFVTGKSIKVDGNILEYNSVYWFDAKTYLPVMIESFVPGDQSKGMTNLMKLGDYREVGGLMFPFSITQGIKGGASQSISISSIELNPKVDPSIFVFPNER